MENHTTTSRANVPPSLATEVGDSPPAPAPASVDETERLIQLESEHGLLLREVAEVAFDIEQQDKRNRQTEVSYLKKFGAREQELAVMTFKLSLLEIRVLLKKQEPHLDQAGLEDRVAEVRDERNRELRRQQAQVEFSQAVDRPEHIAGDAMSPERHTEYLRLIKAKLLRIKIQLHRDKLAQDPRYQNLPDAAKKELDEIWSRATRLRPAELGFDPTQLGYDLPDATRLDADIERAEFLLGTVGMNPEADERPRGARPADLAAWYERKIRELSAVERDLLIRLREVRTDPRTLQRRDLLARPEDHEGHRAALEAEMEEKQRAEARLESELAALFKEGPR